MANKIALVTDSTCDIPQEWREKYEITVVPSIIVFGEKQYIDGVEMTAEQFYDQLPKEKVHPFTSHPTPAAFLEAYREAKRKGAKEIITVTVAAAMSGTITAAQQAAEQIDIPVHVVDSCSNSMGMGWQIIAAARARDKGGDLTDMLAAIEHVRQHIVYYVSLNTLEYLSKGGRIGDAIRLVESVLTIKPLVYVKRENGTVGVSLPARSRKLAISGLQREFFKNVNIKMPMHIAVLHNNALEEAKALAQKVIETYNPVELITTIVSPVLGVHTGPQAIALCGYSE
ncbi:MAG: fatty acid kinase fatty acid binding subunit [Chloroflexota bacterium]|nr:fatty acid kinase fatty acid binding subunit [Chloroflexota bacterium]